MLTSDKLYILEPENARRTGFQVGRKFADCMRWIFDMGATDDMRLQGTDREAMIRLISETGLQHDYYDKMHQFYPSGGENYKSDERARKILNTIESAGWRLTRDG